MSVAAGSNEKERVTRTGVINSNAGEGPICIMRISGLSVGGPGIWGFVYDSNGVGEPAVAIKRCASLEHPETKMREGARLRAQNGAARRL